MNGATRLVINSSRLKQLRSNMGLSQEGLADACEQRLIRVSIATIKRAETDRPVSNRTAHNLANFFNIDVADLLTNKASATVEKTPRKQKSKLYLLIAIHTSSDELMAQLSKDISRLTTLPAIGHHSAKLQLVPLPSADAMPKEQVLNQLVYIWNNARKAASIIKPFSLCVSALYCETDQHALSQVTEKAAYHLTLFNRIPNNRLIVTEEVKVAFQQHFYFNHIETISQCALWSLDHELNLYQGSRIGLLGRSGELNQLTSIIAGSLSHNKRTLACVHGIKGIGKTRFLEEIGRHFHSNDVHVVYADLARGELDWWSITELLLPLSDQKAKAFKVLIIIDNIDLASDRVIDRINKIRSPDAQCNLSILVSTNTATLTKVNDRLQIDHQFELTQLDQQECCKQLQDRLNLERAQAEQIIVSSSCIPTFLRILLLRETDNIEDALRMEIQSRMELLSSAQKQLIHILAIYDNELTISQANGILGAGNCINQIIECGLVTYSDFHKVTLINRITRAIILDLIEPEQRQHIHQRIAEILTSNEDNITLALLESANQHYKSAMLFANVAWCCRKIAYLNLESAEYIAAEHAITEGLRYLNKADASPIQARTCEQPISESIEIDLLLLQANLYKQQHGWGHYKLEEIYLSTLDKCELLSTTTRKMESLFGLWSFYFSNGNLKMAQYYAVKSDELTKMGKNNYYKMLSLTALSNTSLWRGEHQNAVDNAKRALSYFNPFELDEILSVEGQDPRVLPYYIIVMAKLMLDESDSADALAELLDIAAQTSNLFSQAIAYQTAALFHLHMRAPSQAKYHAQRLFSLSSENTFAYYQGLATMIQGWAEYQISGDSNQIGQVVAAYENWMTNAGGTLCFSLYAVILGELLIAERQYDTALELIDDAALASLQNQSNCYISELLALKSICTNDRRYLDDALSHPYCSPRQRRLIETHHGIEALVD
ncbi:hypothetical protein [Ferrimonas pelagia]|uniref:HTH cro/C1-type domain-containing protein n=1 Tax=Ferrimonas pelagia TaxID=1177826 RepID=A0ABP9FGT0_9GAMM